MRMTEKEYEELLRKRKKEKNENKKIPKYRAEKTVVDGITFDSKKEAKRYTELKVLEKIGEISNLEMQVSFELIPTQRDENGVLLERKCTYIADFCYMDKNGNKIVEDTKSEATQTPQYRIKRKLMLFIHGIRIKEV